MAEYPERIIVRVTDPMLADLVARANRRGITLSELVRRMLGYAIRKASE